MMKKYITIASSLICLIIIFSFTKCETQNGGGVVQSNLLNTGIDSLNYIQVSKSVVMVHNEKAQGSNMVCVALDDGLVFFDCSLFTEISQAFRMDMEKKYNLRTLALVHTHAHVDHFLGMNAFKDVMAIASLNAKRMFATQLGIDFVKYKEGYKSVFPLFEEALKSAIVKQPTVWFDQSLEIGSGDNRLILKNAGGHSECSIYGYFEKEKVIITGDDIQVGYHLYFGDPSGDLNEWIATLGKWEEMDVSYVCAGHGPLTDKTYISATRIFLEELVLKLNKLKEKDASIDEVLEVINEINAYWPSDIEKPGWYDAAIKGVYSMI